MSVEQSKLRTGDVLSEGSRKRLIVTQVYDTKVEYIWVVIDEDPINTGWQPSFSNHASGEWHDREFLFNLEEIKGAFF